MTKYDITGMKCAGCSARVESAVKKIPGVTMVSVNLLTNSMIAEGKFSDKEIFTAVEKLGFGIKLSEGDDIINATHDEEKLLNIFIVSAVLLIIQMFLSMGVSMLNFPFPSFLTDDIIWIIVALLSLTILILNRRFFISGFKGLVHGAPNMDTLVAMGSFVSFIYSAYHLVMFIAFDQLSYENFFFDSASMILVLITIGKILEAKTKGKTTNAIKSLISLTPDKALIEKDGKTIEIPVKEIMLGDIVIVKPGNIIPVDCEIISGETKINESMLTGESELVNKTIGDEISAGTINMTAEIKCKAIRIGRDTTLAKIIKLVSDTTASKAPISRIADKVSRIFVPVVIGLAVLTFVIWMLIGKDVGFSVLRAISVLVVSCPCSLGLATPVAIMVANGIAARNGILFKTSEALENAGKTNIICLDKTGTITKGIVSYDGDNVIVTEDEIRSDSKDAVLRLKSMGIKTYMLTGDKYEVAKRIADSAQIEKFISDIKPDGKAEEIAKLKNLGKVAMVGDGINDAPALTIADTSIAIGAGSDIATQSAEIVLMKNTLIDAVAAIKLSKLTIRNIKQNLFWAFCYNIIGIPLAAGVFIGLFGWTLTPIFSALCMSISSIIVVTNALRLNLKNIYK